MSTTPSLQVRHRASPQSCAGVRTKRPLDNHSTDRVIVANNVRQMGDEMGIRIQKYELAHRLMCLFVVYLLLTSFGVLAREWCPNPSTYGYYLRTSGISFGPYPTDMAALQAAMDAYQYGGNQRTTVISCNGQGVCTACFNWISDCNNNATVWNGYDDFLNRLPGSYSLILPCDCGMLSSVAARLTTCTSSLSVTLSGGTEVEPSSTSSTNTLPVIATVKDQNTGQPPTSPVKVHISLKVEPNSGGHEHGDSARPRGGIANVGTCPSDSKCWEKKTDGNGAAAFNFNAPEASGTHTITASCEGCSNTATKTVDVKINGLNPIPALPFYALNEANGNVIGAKTGWHTDNHNLTPAAAAVLTKIAVNYHFNPKFHLRNPITNRVTLPPVLHLNDASLPWGGVYDICARPNACTDTGVVAWHKPHAEHRRGTVIDVRANGADGSIPASNMEAFKRYLRRTKLPFLHESIGTSNEHFHIRLMKKKE